MSEGIIFLLTGLLLTIVAIIIREIEDKKNKQPTYILINTWFYYCIILIFLLIGIIKLL